MPSVTALIGLGVPPRQAGVLGNVVTAKTATGIAQVGAVAITSNFTNLTTTTGQTAAILPAEMVGAGPVVVAIIGATAGLVFPPVGATMNGTLNASAPATANKANLFYSVGPNAWVSNLSA